MSIYSGPNTTQSGLVLHIDPSNPRSYPGSGNTIFDISGNGNNGTLTNGASVISQRRGRALDFDGSDDWVNLGDVLGFAGANQRISVSSWGRLKATNDAMRPFSKCRASNTTTGWEVASYFSGSYYVYWFSANSNFPARCFVQAIASGGANVWRHYAVTFDASLGASSGVRIYENGNLLTNQVLENGSLNIASNLLTSKIGASDTTASPGTPTDFSPAILDDIRIYNRALSPQEIINNFNATRGRFGI